MTVTNGNIEAAIIVLERGKDHYQTCLDYGKQNTNILINAMDEAIMFLTPALIIKEEQPKEKI